MMRTRLPPWKWTARHTSRQREWTITIHEADQSYIVGENELTGWTMQEGCYWASLGSDGSVMVVDQTNRIGGAASTTHYSHEAVQEVLGKLLLGKPLADVERVVSRLVAGVAIATDIKRRAERQNHLR